MNAPFALELLTLSSISAEFGSLVDGGQAAACERLFAPGARMIFAQGSPKPGTLDGLEAIRTFLIARQAQTHVTTRHIATNFHLTWNGGSEAKLESLLTVFRSDDAGRAPVVSVVCDIEEIFTRQESGAWLIQERLTRPVFMHAAS